MCEIVEGNRFDEVVSACETRVPKELRPDPKPVVQSRRFSEQWDGGMVQRECHPNTVPSASPYINDLGVFVTQAVKG